MRGVWKEEKRHTARAMLRGGSASLSSSGDRKFVRQTTPASNSYRLRRSGFVLSPAQVLYATWSLNNSAKDGIKKEKTNTTLLCLFFGPVFCDFVQVPCMLTN